MKRQSYAHSFRSPLSMEEISGELNRSSRWKWTWRDSDRWDDHISARALERPHFGVVKILREDGQSVINVLLQVESDDEAEAAEISVNRQRPR